MKYILTALFIFAASLAQAAVTYDEDTHTMRITGVTDIYMLSDVQKMLAAHDVDTIYMKGPGGDYYAGLSIGRAIQKEGSRVIVARGDECVSACAFAALGGADVFVDGVLLFHKPYVTSVPAHATIDEMSAQYGVVYLDMAQYLVEVGSDMKFAKRLLKQTNYCKFLQVNSKNGMDNPKFIDRCG